MREVRAEMSKVRTEIGVLRAGMGELGADLTATFRAELNAALLHATRTMLVGLVGTLVTTLGLAIALGRFA